MPKPGDAAPEFSAKDHTGQEVKLADLQGKRVVLWFYPKADTPGCTREGCGFRDLYAEYQAKGAEVFGVSYDTPEDNAAFVEKYRFPYKLLSDSDRAIARAYGAWSDASPDYPSRNTYVIGADGKLEQVHEAVNAKTHPRALLDGLT